MYFYDTFTVVSLKCGQELPRRSPRDAESHQLCASGTPEPMDDIYSVRSRRKRKARDMADISQFLCGDIVSPGISKFVI